MPRQHYNHIHFWKWMKKGGGGNKLPGALQKAVDSRSRRLRQVQGRFHRRRHDAVRLGLGLGFGQGRQAGDLQDAERREPARSRRHADPRRRRLGALLLHRLPQRPAEISRGVRRQPDQLGPRAGTLRKGDSESIVRKAPAIPGPFFSRRMRCRWLRRPGKNRPSEKGIFRPPHPLTSCPQMTFITEPNE